MTRWLRSLGIDRHQLSYLNSIEKFNEQVKRMRASLNEDNFSTAFRYGH